MGGGILEGQVVWWQTALYYIPFSFCYCWFWGLGGKCSNQSNEGGCWASCFSRFLNDWDMNLVERFPLSLHRRRVSSKEEDKVIWTRLKIGKFSIKALYTILELGCITLFLTCVIWNSWVLSKVSFFAWEATWSKVLTLDHLKRRGWSLVNRYFLC